MIKNILIYLLLGALGLFAFNNYLKERAINSLTAQNTTLEKDLKAQITFAPKGKVIYKTRTVQGEVKVTVKYLPPEGNVTISQPTDGGNIEMRVNALGLTFRPALLGLLGKEAQIGLGARLFYWDRYGAGLGLGFSRENITPLIFCDRRIDDLVPFFYNSALGAGLGYQNNGISFLVSFNAYL